MTTDAWATLDPERQRVNFVVALMCLPAITSLAGLVRSLGLPHLPVLAIGYGLVALFGFRSLKSIHKAVPNSAWVVSYLLLLALTVGLLRAHDSGSQAQELFPGVILGLVWLLAMSSITTYTDLTSKLPWVGGVVLIGTLIAMLLWIASSASKADYDQHLGYMVLPAVIFLSDYAIETFSLPQLLLAVVAWATMLSMGARGPVVAALLFLGLRVALNLRQRPVITVIALTAFAITIRYLDLLLSGLQGAIVGLGLSTRIFDREQAGTLFQDEARIRLLEETIKIINSHPIFGVGVGNERPLLAKVMTISSDDVAGWYPHNVFLEIGAQFGIILGTAILVALVIRVVLCLLDRSDLDRSRLTLMFVALGVFPLFFSSSYLDWPWFYAMLGLVLRPLIRGAETTTMLSATS